MGIFCIIFSWTGMILPAWITPHLPQHTHLCASKLWICHPLIVQCSDTFISSIISISFIHVSCKLNTRSKTTQVLVSGTSSICVNYTSDSSPDASIIASLVCFLSLNPCIVKNLIPGLSLEGKEI